MSRTIICLFVMVWWKVWATDTLVALPLFTKVGTLSSDFNYGHLTITVSLDTTLELMEECKRLEHHLDVMLEEKELKMTVSKRKHVEWLSQFVKDRTMHTKQKVDIIATVLEGTTPASAERDKRQILATLGGLATGAIITSIWNGFSQRTLLDILNRKEHILETTVQRSELRLDQVQADLNRLKMVTTYMKNEIGKALLADAQINMQMVQLLTLWSLELSLESTNNQLDAIIAALNGRFDTGLVSMKDLDNGLNALREKAQADRKVLSIRNTLETFQLATSFVFNASTMELHLIIHVPVHDHSKTMTLYRYIPTPIQLPQQTLWLEVRPDNELIGVSDDATLYKTMSRTELDSCTMVQNVYFCPGTAFFKIRRESCLAGLYFGRFAEVRKHCPLSFSHGESMVNRINSTTYAVSQTTAGYITVECPVVNMNKRMLVSGTSLVTLEPGCSILGKDFLVRRPQYEMEINLEASLAPRPLQPEDLLEPDEVEDLHHLDTLIAQVGKPIPMELAKHYLMTKRALDAINSHQATVNGLSYFGPAAMIVATCLVAAYVYHRCRVCRERSTANIPSMELTPPSTSSTSRII